MSGRLLSFKEYIGSANNVQVIELFPRSQKSFTYNFGSDVSAYEFSADYQSILLSSVTYDRVTGDPNFADSTVSGYFTNTATVNPSNINNASAASGLVTLTIPENRYTGNVLPNARNNVVMTVLSFQWTTNDSPVQKDLHRWAIIERFDPEVGKVPGDPANEANFVSL